MTRGAESLGSYLKQLRKSTGLTLREVEIKTDGSIKNGYLSQVENGQIKQPSPSVLWELSELYGVDYDDLLVRAGHRERLSDQRVTGGKVAGIPLRALQELTPDEQAELRDYLEFIKHRRRTSVG